MKQAAKNLIGSYLRRARGEGVGAVLFRGFGGTLGINLAGAGTALVVQIVLARLMGAGSYGVFVYVFTWANVLVLVGKFGFEEASPRFVATYNGKGEWSLLRGFLRRGDQITLLTSVSTASVTAGVVWLLRDRLGDGLAVTFWIVCLLLPMYALLQVRGSHLRGLKRTISAQSPLVILRPALLAGGVFLAVVVLGGSSDAPTAMAINLVLIRKPVSWRDRGGVLEDQGVVAQSGGTHERGVDRGTGLGDL